MQKRIVSDTQRGISIFFILFLVCFLYLHLRYVHAQNYGDGDYGSDPYSATYTPTPTNTSTPTQTPTNTNTPTPTDTLTPTNSPTVTPTSTPTPVVSLIEVIPDPNQDTTPNFYGTVTVSTGTITSVEFQLDSTSGSWTACTAQDGTMDGSSELFTCEQTSAISESAHTVYVRATDSNANISDNASDTFTIQVNIPSSSPPANPVQSCGNEKPANAPHLFQVDRVQDKATLHFAPSLNPYNGFIISFGLNESADNYNGSMEIENSPGALEYTVNYLIPGVPYYFKVQSKNGCKTGDWSNVIRAKAVSAYGTQKVLTYPSWVEEASYTVTNATRPVTNAFQQVLGSATHLIQPSQNKPVLQPNPPAQIIPTEKPYIPKQTVGTSGSNGTIKQDQSGNWFSNFFTSLFSLFR